MRDPERIPRIIQKLEAYWRKHPDLRLGQIVENAKTKSGIFSTDVFYVEDDKIEQGLDALDEPDVK